MSKVIEVFMLIYMWVCNGMYVYIYICSCKTSNQTVIPTTTNIHHPFIMGEHIMDLVDERLSQVCCTQVSSHPDPHINH